jgi:hypothetical protein
MEADAPYLRGWNRQLHRPEHQFCATRGAAPASPSVDVKALHAKIGELTLENDFLEGALSKAGLLNAKR